MDEEKIKGEIKSNTKLNKKKEKRKKRHMVQSHSQSRCVFRRLRTPQGVCFTDCCGRAFQSSGAELEKALKPNRKSIGMDVTNMTSEGHGKGCRHCFGGRRKRNVMPK